MLALVLLPTLFVPLTRCASARVAGETQPITRACAHSCPR